ncbi:Ser-Thr-rich GPI-anchored membrane family protein [Geodermatophilus sp. URMC 60]
MVSGGYLLTSTVPPTATPEVTGAGPTTGAQSGGARSVESTGSDPGSSAQPDAAALREAGVITPTAATDEVEGGERGVARSRTVAVDTAALPRTAAEAAQTIELPLFDDTTVVADLGVPEFRTEGGYRTWSGTIAGDESSTVVFVEQDGVLSGMVTSKDATFRLRPLPDGGTAVEQLDESQFPPAHDDAVVPPAHDDAVVPPAHDDAVVPPAEVGADAGGRTDAPPAAGDATGPAGDAQVAAEPTAEAPVVDVLVAYSSAAKARKGGQVGMDADIALMIEQTNSAFSTSGINAAVRLTHTAEVATNAAVDGTTLGKVANRSDGVYDELHVLRDQYGADLVALIVDNPTGSACGIAYLMNPIGPSFASLGMSVTDAGCATGNMSFTHELGHNFGAAHDRGAWAGTPAVPYGYDWVNAQQGWRTVMAYTNACQYCGRLLRFSNPDQIHNGAPLGAPAGAANAADNRALLNTTASTVAGFRGAPAPVSLTVTSPTSGQSVPASGKVVATWSTSGYLGSDAKVELLRGSTVVSVLSPKVALGTGRSEHVVPPTTARGADYRVRVTPLLAPQHAATSDAFTVTDPVLTPSYTLASATPGGRARVAWTHTGAPGGTVKVELLKDGRVLTTLAASAALGTGGAGGVDVTLPAALNDGGGYQFRTTWSVPKVAVLTDAFSVASSRRLVVTSPTDGVTHTAGQPMTVTWTASGDVGTSVKAEVVKGDVVVAASAAVAPGAGRLTFTPPAGLPTGADYRVRLLSVSFPTVVAASDGRFAVDGSSLTVTSQADPTSVTAGRPLTITWTTTGVPGTAVKLEAVAPGRTTVGIAPSAPLKAGAHTWTVPLNVPEGDWTVRATVVGNTLVADTSASPVTVAWPEVSVSAPAAAVAGAPVTVSWAFTDDAVAPVNVRLLQGTKAVLTLATNARTGTDGSGSLTATLPVGLAAGSYRIEVTAAVNALVTGTPADPVAVTLPTLSTSATPVDVAGDLVTVSWRYSDGVVAPVIVRLVPGTGAATTLASGVRTAADGTGSGSYRLPITLAPGTYSVEVSAVGGPGIVGRGTAAAVARPTLTASGASSVARGQAATISWSFSGGASTPVTITLVQGTKVVAVKSGVATGANGSGSLVWTAPTTLAPGSYTLRIRPAQLASSATIEGTRAFTVS